MTVKSRLTVLFESAEDVGNHLSYNDTALTVSGAPNVVAQQRWTWTTTGYDRLYSHQSITRITWAAGKLNSSNWSTILKPVLSPGFNVYSTSDGLLNQSVVTPLFQSIHSQIFNISSFLPEGAGDSLVLWNWENCDLDVRIKEDLTEVSQWCPLSDNETLTFHRDKKVDNAEAGLFYVDVQDGIDVNLSGLRCKWNSTGEIEKCQKTTLFYKRAHTFVDDPEQPNIELEMPVGLHPKILIDLGSAPEVSSCEYFIYLQLPVELFVDKFQSSPLFVFGEHDLELPEYKLRDKTCGSEVLFKLEPGKLNEIILHSRYVEPVEGDSVRTVTFQPSVFRACDYDKVEVSRNPFYSKGLGYEAYFTPDTVFEHFESNFLEVSIPRADLKYYNATKYITLACLIFSLIYLFTKMLKRPRLRRHTTRER